MSAATMLKRIITELNSDVPFTRTSAMKVAHQCIRIIKTKHYITCHRACLRDVLRAVYEQVRMNESAPVEHPNNDALPNHLQYVDSRISVSKTLTRGIFGITVTDRNDETFYPFYKLRSAYQAIRSCDWESVGLAARLDFAASMYCEELNKLDQYRVWSVRDGIGSEYTITAKPTEQALRDYFQA